MQLESKIRTLLAITQACEHFQFTKPRLIEEYVSGKHGIVGQLFMVSFPAAFVQIHLPQGNIVFYGDEKQVMAFVKKAEEVQS